VAEPDSGWQVYILRCADGTLYTGIARDLVRRLAQHNGERAGGPRYTRGRRPVRLLWSCGAGSRGEALAREAAIKRLSRAGKLRLVAAAAGHSRGGR
jgi:putative endonuclease